MHAGSDTKLQCYEWRKNRKVFFYPVSYWVFFYFSCCVAASVTSAATKFSGVKGFSATRHKLYVFFCIDGWGAVYLREERGLSAFSSRHCGFRLRGGANWPQTAEVQSSQRIKGASTGDLLSARHDELRQSNISGLVVALILSSARGDPAGFNCHEVQTWISIQCRGGKSILCTEVK